MDKYPILDQTATVYEASHKQCKNAALVFDRYTEKVNSTDKEAKKRGLERVRDIKRDTKLHAAIIARWQATANFIGAHTFTLQTDWRLVSGVGRHTPFEVGFRFDRYGFATLPGSGLKGLTRSQALLELARALGVKKFACKNSDPPECLEIEDILLMDDAEWLSKFTQRFPSATDDQRQTASDFRVVFGNTDHAGAAIFMDAMPKGDPMLELDILNPHYPEYYSGKSAPTNWQSPVPVYFLTVKPGVTFLFGVGWRIETVSNALKHRVNQWLKTALKELGAGAKTSAGYGYFLELGGQMVAQRQTAPQPVRAMVLADSSEKEVILRGKIEWIDPSKKEKGLITGDDGKEYTFSTLIIKDGQFPGKRKPVEFAMVGDKVIRIKKL